MNARVAHILKSPWTTHIGVGAAMFGGGVGLGYLLWGRKDNYEVLVPAESDEIEFDFDTGGLAEKMASRDPAVIAETERIMVEEGYSTPILAPETEAEVVNDMVVVRPSSTDDETPELIEVNVFEELDNDWDWEKEVESRGDGSKPYVVHRDEFYRNEFNFTQSTLTYYEKDDVLTDETGRPVHPYPKITGPLLFGHGSGDPNTVLIRNHERRGEYEIVRDPGSYEVEVLGLSAEAEAASQDLRHSRMTKFRPGD